MTSGKFLFLFISADFFFCLTFLCFAVTPNCGLKFAYGVASLYLLWFMGHIFYKQYIRS